LKPSGWKDMMSMLLTNAQKIYIIKLFTHIYMSAIAIVIAIEGTRGYPWGYIG